MIAKAQLRALQASEPFRPFVLTLEDNRAVVIRDRNHIWVAPTGKMVGVAHGRGSAEFIELARIKEARLRHSGKAKAGTSHTE